MANDYKVLYRKYRPTTFDEIVGQKYSITMLKNTIINNKISHAYLFTGPRGTGKTSTAKIFAKTINCENPKNGIPCGECPSCLNSNSADIIEIDAASNNGVDSIREIINNVKIAPTFSKYKIYIIDEVHELSSSAFNALLLTLEEPPSHVVFIFATTNIEKVPITILSRCQRYDFRKLTNEELKSHLLNIAQKENIKITEDAIEEIAYLSDGGCRDALSILNQLSTSNENIDLNTVLSNYGSVSSVQIKNIVNAYMEDSYEQLKNIFDTIEKSSIDYKVFLKKLVDQFFSEAITCKTKNNNSMYLKIKNTIFELNDLINKININVDPFMLIFLVLIENIQTTENTKSLENNVVKDISDNAMPKKQAQPKEKVEIVTEKKKITIEEPLISDDFIEKLRVVRINNCFAKADKNLLMSSKERWESFNSKIGSTDMIKSIIIDTNVVLASENINIITDAQESIVDMFNHNLHSIEEKYKEVENAPLHFIALTIEEWEKYKKDYVKKLKEKYIYQIMEEPIMEQGPSLTEEVKENNYEDIISIFDKEKVEIK